MSLDYGITAKNDKSGKTKKFMHVVDEYYASFEDGWCWVLYEKKQAKSGKDKGKTIMQTVGYWGQLEPLLREAARKVGYKKAETLEEYLLEFQKAVEKIREKLPEIEREGKK